jgi:hypothetical protein
VLELDALELDALELDVLEADGLQLGELASNVRGCEHRNENRLTAAIDF